MRARTYVDREQSARYATRTPPPPPQATFLATHYAVLSLEKCTLQQDGYGTEEGIYKTAVQLKAINPAVEVFMYWGVDDQGYQCSKQVEGLLADHPEYFLHDNKGTHPILSNQDAPETTGVLRPRTPVGHAGAGTRLPLRRCHRRSPSVPPSLGLLFHGRSHFVDDVNITRYDSYMLRLVRATNRTCMTSRTRYESYVLQATW